MKMVSNILYRNEQELLDGIITMHYEHSVDDLIDYIMKQPYVKIIDYCKDTDLSGETCIEDNLRNLNQFNLFAYMDHIKEFFRFRPRGRRNERIFD